MIAHLHRSLLLVLGGVCVGLGVVGIFLPLLPTTPFLLVSAYCFSKSSPRLHNLLLANRYLGPVIIDWEKEGAIKLRVKWSASVLMTMMVSYPIIFVIQNNWLRMMIICSVVLVLVFMWTRPTAL